MLQYIHSLYYMFMKLYLVLLQVCGAMGVRRNFSKGGGKVDILLIISGCWRCNANRCIQKKKMSNVMATVAYSVFLARNLYTEQMFVLVSTDILRLGYHSSK